MCDIAVVEVAPCQCRSLAGHQTTSPARISNFGPPSLCTHPQPCVTTSVCPSGCQCHADLAPGSKVTSAQLTRAGSAACINGSMRTLPVKYSSGPLPEGCEPFLLISISESLHSTLFLVVHPISPRREEQPHAAREALSITKRYLTSLFSMRSYASSIFWIGIISMSETI